MAAYLAPSLATLERQVDARFPHRATRSDGWLGDADHQARASQHNRDRDGSVDAIDLTHGPAFGKPDLDCRVFVAQLVASGDPRLQRVIWDRHIWDPARKWRRYFGDNPHDHHCHVETTDRGQSDGRLWRLPMFGAADPIPAGDVLDGATLLELMSMGVYVYADGREGIWWTDFGLKRWARSTAEIEQAKWSAGLIGGPKAAAAIAPRRIELEAFDRIPIMPGTELPPSMAGGRPGVLQPFHPAVP